ncbi:MAG: MoxR family ATPase [Deltaproteobacteria bacterium]|nr:MoxR family ATPase [Deltaproteobacteria bacterium]
MNDFNAVAGQAEVLPAYGTLSATHHVFEKDSIEAVNCALAAGRPLLVRGEPGTGKSQLARAVAHKLGRAYLSYTVDSRTESRDLIYAVDTVARLAAAQIAGHLYTDKKESFKEELTEKRFTSPGPLWWVLNWQSAANQAEWVGDSCRPRTPQGWQRERGAVVLIDEIDKADSSVPNGLLEALGQREFRAPGGEVVAADPEAAPPVVIITTNEERALPDAFVRRCLVLPLAWSKDREKLKTQLRARGKAHFPSLEKKVLDKAAEMVAQERESAAEHNVCPPGGAEYLDLLRVVAVRWKDAPDKQLEALCQVGSFVLEKHPKELGWA